MISITNKKEHEKNAETKHTEHNNIDASTKDESASKSHNQQHTDLKLDAKISKVDAKEYEIQELTNTLKRLQAEFENYKKRSDKENVNTIKNANLNLIKELLPVLDSFELALKNNTCENPEVAKYRKGLELIYSQLYSILEDKGLRPIDTKNQKFDPFKHEVLLVKECNEKDDLILQEFQKGYMLNENIIRHSKVMIAKHVDEKKEEK